MKKLLASYAIVTVCSWTLAFLIPLYVFDLTKSAAWTALTYCTAMAPYILVTPFAGVWSDRYEKRRFLIIGDVCSLLAAGALYLSVSRLTGTPLVWMLMFISFLLASISATHHPMFQSLAPQIMKARELTSFNSIVNAYDNLVRIIAPISVALMLTFISKDIILLICGSGFLLSIPLLRALPATLVETAPDSSVMADLREGVRFVMADANLISFSLLFFCVNFGLALIGSNLIYLFVSVMAVGQNGVGIYYAIIALGAVTGSFMAPKLIGNVSDSVLIVSCCALAGVFALIAASVSDPLHFALIWALSTACTSIVVVTFFTFRQKVVPQKLLGRTVGVTRLISYLAIPPASIIGGMVMERTDRVAPVMLMGGTAIILGSLVAILSPAVHAPLLQKWRKI